MSSIARWEPFAEFGELRTRLDNLFGSIGDGGQHRWTPAVDVIRDDGNLVLTADLPGLAPDEVTIEVEDGILTIAGEHSEQRRNDDEHYVRRERRTGSFARSMALPAGIDPKQIQAQTKDGVMRVTIRLPAKATRETITVTPTSG